MRSDKSEVISLEIQLVCVVDGMIDFALLGHPDQDSDISAAAAIACWRQGRAPTSLRVLVLTAQVRLPADRQKPWKVPLGGIGTRMEKWNCPIKGRGQAVADPQGRPAAVQPRP